ncbi:hypothetical protein QQP08_007100 [Theobroma cacao]|nr:hypothetical protein QQP08_007100 [Theobroma cacao]
MLQLAK